MTEMKIWDCDGSGEKCNVGFAVKEGWTIMWLPEFSLSMKGGG